MFVFYFGKASLPLFLFGSHRHVLLAHRNKKSNLVFRTTRAEDTHLKLAAASFQVGVNNSLEKIAVIHTREKFCRVSVPVGSITPCFVTYL